ncbi:MAG: hypothetical protein R3C97_09415 [Geminicoccaceae bacterium]
MVSVDAPLWLLLPPVLWIAFLLNQRRLEQRRKGLPGDWSSVCEPALHTHLARHVRSTSTHARLLLVLVTATALSLALARIGIGRGVPDEWQGIAGRVIVADMGEPFDAPSVRLAIAGLLAAGREAPTALIAASSQSYDVVPFTTDYRQIERYVAVLDTDVLPLTGQDVSGGLAHAIRLAERRELRAAQIVLVTSSPAPSALGSLKGTVGIDLNMAVMAKPDILQSWLELADRHGLDLVDNGDAADLQDELRATVAGLRQELGGGAGIDLTPFLAGLAALAWLALFRRFEA